VPALTELTPPRPSWSRSRHDGADQRLTVADVAGRIGAHEQTVRGWIKTGELKAARFGIRIGYRIKCSDYEDFLRRRTLTGAIAAHLLREASTAPDA
jgi:excisionase family DNA binding protein